MGDLPFTVYFNFETTRGDDIMKNPKKFVISYCQIFAFHPNLKLNQIVIFRSFQQNAEKVYSLDHFSHEYFTFFDAVTFSQMKDAATNVFINQKSTSLSELFSIDLKFTIETLTIWFNNSFKSKFLDSNDIQKQISVKENPLD